MVYRLFAIAALVVLTAFPASAQRVAQISPEGVSHIVAPPQMQALGAAQARVTVVEYLDYNCPYCRKIAPDLRRLTGADRDVRVLFKDWPIFGAVSTYAARAAMAANWQGKYLTAHHALISTPERLSSEADVRDTLQKAGVALGRLDTDLKAHSKEIDALLARNASEASALGLEGTPGVLVGDILVPGSISYTDLRTLVAKARESHHS